MGCINWMVLQKSKKLKSGVLLSQRINHYAPFSHVLLTPRHAKGDWASARYRIRFSVQNSIMTTTGQRADIFLRVSNPEGFYLLDIWSYSTPTFNFANLWKKKTYETTRLEVFGRMTIDSHRLETKARKIYGNPWEPPLDHQSKTQGGVDSDVSLGKRRRSKLLGFGSLPNWCLNHPSLKKKRNWKIFFSFRVENEKLCETTTWAKLFGH